MLAQKCVEYEPANRPDFSEILKMMRDIESDYKEGEFMNLRKYLHLQQDYLWVLL